MPNMRDMSSSILIFLEGGSRASGSLRSSSTFTFTFTGVFLGRPRPRPRPAPAPGVPVPTLLTAGLAGLAVFFVTRGLRGEGVTAAPLGPIFKVTLDSGLQYLSSRFLMFIGVGLLSPAVGKQ